MLGLHNYHDVFKTFPPPCVFNEQGEPLHSWRALILPFMNFDQAAHEYSMSEAWHTPGNLAVMKELSQGPYMCPDHGLANFTSYLAVTGEDTAWPNAGRAMRAIPDGISKTIMILEINSAHILWTDPKDITCDEAVAFLCEKGVEDFIGHESEGRPAILAAFGDGTVQTLTLPMARNKAMELLYVNDAARSKKNRR